jgi:hypothetical protein
MTPALFAALSELPASAPPFGEPGRADVTLLTGLTGSTPPPPFDPVAVCLSSPYDCSAPVSVSAFSTTRVIVDGRLYALGTAKGAAMGPAIALLAFPAWWPFAKRPKADEGAIETIRTVFCASRSLRLGGLRDTVAAQIPRSLRSPFRRPGGATVSFSRRR